MKPRVALVTVTYQAAHNCSFFIPSLECNTESIAGIFIIDNNSRDETRILLDRFKKEHENMHVTIMHNAHNYGYAHAINIGIQQALREAYDYILVTNNDIIFHEGAIAQLIHDARHSRAHVIGVPASINSTELGLGYKMNHTTHLPDHSPTIQRTDITKEIDSDPLPHIDFVHGGTILFSSSFFERIGLYDDTLFFGGDELDFLYRVMKYNEKNTLPITCVVSLRTLAKMDNLTKHNSGHKIIKAKRILQGTVRVYLKHRYTPISWGLYKEVYTTIRNLGKRSISRYLVLSAFALRALTLEVLRYYTR